MTVVPGLNANLIATLATAVFVALAGPQATARADTAARCAAEAPTGVVDNCRIALEGSPADIELRRLLAQGLLVAGDEAGSLAAYEALAIDHADDPRAQYEYGVTLIALQHYNHGADLMARAIALDPDYLEAQLAGSIIFVQVGRKEEAFAALTRAAALGSELAMFELAETYRLGYGTDRDPDAALHWLIKAAENGHITAMERLAAVYLDGGYGVAPDDALAEKWAVEAQAARQALQ